MASGNVCWGIDIGAGAISALKLERDGDNVKVADMQIIPHKKVLSTPEINEADAMRVALGALMSQIRDATKGASVAVSVPGHTSFARFAKLPPVEPKGVASLVRFEAVQQIPFPIEEVEWDYQTFKSDDSPDIEVGIFAMTRERVNERLSLWGDLGLNPDILTLGPVAAYNAIAYDLNFSPTTPGTIILDIGTMATDLIIAEAGRLWIRTFPLGGHQFTEALAEAFKLTYSKAERLKREAETSKYKKHVFQAIKPVLADLVQDVQRSISYYQDTHPDARITRLIGIGSTFKILGLRKLLSQQLKMEVHRFERFQRLTVDGAAAADFEAATPNLATAYGLALQGLGLTPIRANLMPVSVIRTALWKQKMPWFLAAAGIGLVGGGVSFLRPFLDSTNLQPPMQDQRVRNAINNGERLKGEWESAKAENQPKFFAVNVLRLLDGQKLYEHVLTDVESMIASATAMPTDGGKSRTGLAYDLRELSTQYLPPGAALEAPVADQNSQGGSSGGSGTQGWGGDREAPAPPAEAPIEGAEGDDSKVAGQFGALRVTMTVDSQDPGKQTFFNDSILEWLNKHVEREGVPYKIVKIPKIEEVKWMEIAAAAPAGGPGSPPPPSGSPDRPPPGGGRPRGDAPGDDRGGSGTQGWGNPAPGSSADSGTLDQKAPLPPPPVRGNDGARNRYTLTWFVQLKDQSAWQAPKDEAATGEAGEPSADATPAEDR